MEPETALSSPDHWKRLQEMTSGLLRVLTLTAACTKVLPTLASAAGHDTPLQEHGTAVAGPGH